MSLQAPINGLAELHTVPVWLGSVSTAYWLTHSVDLFIDDDVLLGSTPLMVF